MGNKAYLGTGMKFPPQINPANGRIVTASEEVSIKESVYLILMTSKTERLVRPNFGSRINAYTFMDINYTVLNMLSRELTEMILNNEPRISDCSVEIENQTRQGRLIINISYQIAATHQKDSLVFPYYLDSADEAEENMELDQYADYSDYEEEIENETESID